MPHRHTSYGSLLLLLGLTGVLILLFTLGVALPGNADSGAIAVTGTVSGPPPTTAPIITAPANGTRVSDQQLTVSGSCNSNLIVVVMSNHVGRGSTMCNPNGAFSLIINLSIGTNVLVGYHLDALGQNGPASAPVSVTYQPRAAANLPGSTPSPLTSGSTSGSASNGSELTITAPYRFDAIQPGQTFILRSDLEGGTPPYAVQVGWGDSNQALLSRAAVGPFTTSHTYARAGQFVIKLTASDATGQTAYYQTVASSATAAKPAPTPSNPPVVVPAYQLAIIWPLFLVTCLGVVSFWLGERYDRHFWVPPPTTPTT